MENKTSSDYEKLDPAYEIKGHFNPPSSSDASRSYHQGLEADDILIEDLPEDEIFVLSEEYVLMEDEYVLWEQPLKTKEKEPGNDYEGQLILPFEDSLHSLGEYFTLKTISRPISHN